MICRCNSDFTTSGSSACVWVYACVCVCVVPSSIKNRLSNYGPATTAQQPTLVPLHQPQLSNYGSATNPGFASATTAQQPQSSSIPSHCLNLALLHVAFLNSQALPFQEFLSRFKVSVYLNLHSQPGPSTSSDHDSKSFFKPTPPKPCMQ